VSKLPVLSGAECIKALGKVGFEVYRQRGSHIVVVRKSRPHKPQFPITKSWIEAPYARLSAKPVSLLKNS
jgi:hypothetical protein